jgi:glycopeptide antibiotics resistance protein
LSATDTAVRLATRTDGANPASSRGLSIAWPIVATAAVLYGSLLPFEWQRPALSLSNAFGLKNIGFVRPGLEDIIVNILVYFPLGLILAVSGRASAAGRLARIPLIVLVGAVVSLSAEVAQTGIANRCPSWIDVFLNVTGTAVGAILGATMFRAGMLTFRRLQRGMAERPFTTLSSFLTIGLILYGLAPYDFVTSTAGMHESFLRARWTIAAPGQPAPGEPPFTTLVQQVIGAAWFAGLGLVLGLAALEKSRHIRPAINPQRNNGSNVQHPDARGNAPGLDTVGSKRAAQTRAAAFGSAVTQGLAVAVIIEVLQLFTLSHVFDLAGLLLRAMAVALAAWWAAFVCGETWPSENCLRLRRAVPTLGLVTMAACHLFALFVLSTHLDISWPNEADWAKVHWLPFESLWLSPASHAASEILATMANYGILAVVLGVVFRRSGVRGAWTRTAILVVLFAATVEASQMSSGLHTPDVTEPLLALGTVIMISRAYAVVRPDAPAIQRRALRS